MRLLVLVWAFPPKSSTSGIRAAALANHWVRLGYEVDVVTSWSPGLEEEEVLGRLRIFRVGGWIERRRAIMRNGPVVAHDPGVSAPRARGLALGHRLLRAVYDMCWRTVYWPDHACLWISAAREKSLELSRMGNYDGVISISFPFSSHLVALGVKRRHPDLPWIMDALDPFSLSEASTPNNRLLYHRLNRRTERFAFRRATAVVVNSEFAATRYRNVFPESKDKIRVLPTTAPEWSLMDAESANDLIFNAEKKIRLTFTGALYSDIRNPEFLLSVFDRLLGTRIGQHLELHFFGNVSDCGRYFQRYASSLGSRIIVHGQVAHATAIRAMLQSDILVNLGNTVPYQLPSKVVEYATTGKPVLNIVRGESDSSLAFFRSYPAALSLLEQAASLTPEAIEDVVRFIETSQSVDKDVLNKWLQPYRVESVCTAFEQYISQAGNPSSAERSDN